MACLDSLIGIKGCTTSVGSSPYYIEDIGITPTEADQYINKEYPSGIDLIEDKIDLATRLVSDLIINHFSPNLIRKSLLESQLLGQYQDNLNLKSGIASTYGGISLTLNNQDSYFKVFVNSISLQINSTGNVNVFVFDLISGTLLDTIVVATVTNVISTTFVNKTYSSPKRKLDLIFVYDTEGISSNTTNLANSGCTSCNGYVHRNYYISAAPISIGELDTKIRSMLTTQSHTFGLSVNYSIQCSFDNWLCEIANLMALPILYKAGMEIMEYAALYSNRQTSNVNIDAERNKERLNAYSFKYNEALQATVSKIVLPKHDKCFLCDKPVELIIALP